MWEWANGVFGRAWAKEGQDPAASFDHQYKIEAVLDSAGMPRAHTSDTNHFLYLVKANQVFWPGTGQAYGRGSAVSRHPQEVREIATLIGVDRHAGGDR